MHVITYTKYTINARGYLETKRTDKDITAYSFLRLCTLNSQICQHTHHLLESILQAKFKYNNKTRYCNF